MSVSIRLSRGGSKKRPYYRIVVANSTAPRDGHFLEKIGSYTPIFVVAALAYLIALLAIHLLTPRLTPVEV